MDKKMLTSMKSGELQDALKSGNLRACVIGIGRIGLPTALSFARAGLPTTGLDINEGLVRTINSGGFPLKDEPGYEEIFREVTDKGMFTATTDPASAIPDSDIVVLSLPTPMDALNIPDYSALRAVGAQLHELLCPASVIVVESTVEPGFVEDDLRQIVEGDGARLKASVSFGMGACPETANPGEILGDFAKLPRLVGALDERTTDVITAIYSHVFGVEIVKMSDCKTANAVKLTTNVFRDINIAFVNELALLFEKLDIDIIEVIGAAKRKYNFQVHYPGAGVGGPCLPVNSYQFLNTAKRANHTLSIVKAGREINEGMHGHVVRLLDEGLKEAGREIKGAHITVLGASYKPNVKDTQLSPARPLIEGLLSRGADVRVYDPYFTGKTVFGIRAESGLYESISGADAIVIVTAHDEFLALDPARIAGRCVIVDSCGVMDAGGTDLIYRGIGRGRRR